jgi:hypothetical protein
MTGGRALRGFSLAVVAAALACAGNPLEAGSAETGGGGDDLPTTLDGPDDDGGPGTLDDTSATGADDGDTSDTSPEPMCGNGMVEPPEECDIGPGNTMGASCTDECTDNDCGDGYVGYGESCDPPGRGCGRDCIFESCGDGDLDPGEECDWAMTPMCSMTCMLPGCGDGIIDAALGEQCEGMNLGGASCLTFGYVLGELQCDLNCHFIVSDCTNCGDDMLQGGEQCDGPAGPQTCEAAGFDEGTLACTACLLDVSGCVTYMCGNGMLEGIEECDGADLGGNTCASLGYAPTDDLACLNCVLDPTACTLCGNGMLDVGETCDMGAPFPDMCNEVPPFDNSAAVTCNNATCMIDTTMCCGDDDDDPCMGDDDCCGAALECGNDGLCCRAAGSQCGGVDAVCCSGDCAPDNTCTMAA